LRISRLGCQTYLLILSVTHSFYPKGYDTQKLKVIQCEAAPEDISIITTSEVQLGFNY